MKIYAGAVVALVVITITQIKSKPGDWTYTSLPIYRNLTVVPA